MLNYGQLLAGSKHKLKCLKIRIMRLLQSTVSCAVSWCKWAWMLTAVDLHWFIPPEALTWWATNISSVSLETQLIQPGSHWGGRICTSATCASLACGLCSVQEMNGIDMVTELFPPSKSAPRRKQFSPGERNVVHPNTASRNNHPREWFPQQLKIWPNTILFFFFFKWNLLQLHYSRHGLECKQHCWAITWQPGRKRAKNKSETEYLDYGGWPEVKWERARGSRDQAKKAPGFHTRRILASHSWCLLLTVCHVCSLLGPKEKYLHMMSTESTLSPALMNQNLPNHSRGRSKVSCSLIVFLKG